MTKHDTPVRKNHQRNWKTKDRHRFNNIGEWIKL